MSDKQEVDYSDLIKRFTTFGIFSWLENDVVPVLAITDMFIFRFTRLGRTKIDHKVEQKNFSVSKK
jgi:hypothetical protein